MRVGIGIVVLLLALIPTRARTQSLFTDVTEEAGVAFRHSNVIDVLRMAVGTGAAWFDFNRDGLLDLYVTQGNGANALFRNDGGGRFTDVAELTGATDRHNVGGGVAVGDFDNDGWPDLYLANSDNDVLLKNDSGRAFVDVTKAVGLSGKTNERGTAAAWGDYDGDGFLDLYVVNHMDVLGLAHSSRDRLFHNNAGQSFTEVSDLLDTNPLGYYAFAATWTDFDNDGDLDLLVVNDCGFADSTRNDPMKLYRNDGGTDPLSWTFTEVSREVGADHCRHGMGVAAGDYNRDGWIDYFYTNIGKRTTLLENRQGIFGDVAETAGVYVGFDSGEEGGPFGGTFSWGANFFDYDLDGTLDLYVTAGPLSLLAGTPQPNALFKGRGDGTFEDLSVGSGANLPGRSRTSIIGDYDGDGDPDIFVVNSHQQAILLRNDSGTGHHLIIDLEGTASNRDGIGARIRLRTPDGTTQYFETRSGSSLGGGDDIAAYFGLGSNESVTEIQVAWPSGIVQVRSDVEVNQRITMVEPLITDVEPTAPPADFSVDLFPNPFRPPLTIRLSHPAGNRADLRIYDIAGREVRRLETGGQASGAVLLSWDGLSSDSKWLPAGAYLVRASVSGRSISKPVILMR